MNQLAERRQEEKERRRTEILDAAEAVAAVRGWDAMTMEDVARKARLSRALLYVYFNDKTDLMFGIGERALAQLKQRFIDAIAQHPRGIDRIEAVGRAYVSFSHEFPVYFAVLARCEMSKPNGVDPQTHEGACVIAGDSLQDLLVTTLTEGMRDGSIRADAGDPHQVAVVLWGFLHGVIQLAANKANLMTHRGLSVKALLDQAITQATRSIAVNP